MNNQLKGMFKELVVGYLGILKFALNYENGEETSVTSHHCRLRNVPEEQRSHLHSGGSLK
jgi:hypothetical protein